MKLFNTPYRYLFVIGLGLYSYLNTQFVETYKVYGIAVNPLHIILCLSLISLLVWESNRITGNLLKKQLHATTYRIHPLLIFLAISQVAAGIAGLLVYYLFSAVIVKNHTGNTAVEIKLVLLFSFRINLFLQCIHAIIYFLNNYKQKELEAEELKRITMQAQLQAIRNQVNPHFLFNNLNVLSTLILQKHEDANKFIEEFSSVYRYILKYRDSETVSLETELSFIQPYIFLLKKRFGDALHVDMNIPDEYNEYHIVPVTLQLLVENATKHNVVSASNPLRIILFIQDAKYLVVENNLQEKKEKPQSTEFGLYNIDRRFKITTGKEIIIEKTKEHFKVSIPLIRKEELKTTSITEAVIKKHIGL